MRPSHHDVLAVLTTTAFATGALLAAENHFDFGLEEARLDLAQRLQAAGLVVSKDKSVGKEKGKHRIIIG